MPIKKANIEESVAGKSDVKSGLPWLKLESGKGGKLKTTRLRILPPREDHPTDRFYLWVATHGNLPNAGRAIYCTQKNDDIPCPACEKARELYQAGRKDDARDFNSGWKGLLNVIELDDEGDMDVDDWQIQPWAAPKGLVEDLLDKIDALKKFKDITDLEKGRDVIVGRKGKKITDTKYEIQICEPSSLPEEVIAAIMSDEAELYDLPNIYEKPTTEAVVAMLVAPKPKLLATADAFDDDGDEDTDAIDADYTEVDDEEEEEEEKVVKKTSGKRKVVEDEDEPEEKPAKKSKEEAKNEKALAARDRLLGHMAGKPAKDDDDDEDEEEDEEEDE